MPVGRGAAPLAVLLVIDVFMKPIGAVCALVAVVRAVAVSAFRAHSVILLIVHVKQFLPYPLARNGRKRKTSSESVLPKKMRWAQEDMRSLVHNLDFVARDLGEVAFGNHSKVKAERFHYLFQADCRGPAVSIETGSNFR